MKRSNQFSDTKHKTHTETLLRLESVEIESAPDEVIVTDVQLVTCSTVAVLLCRL